jgi:hypothetical protein
MMVSFPWDSEPRRRDDRTILRKTRYWTSSGKDEDGMLLHIASQVIDDMR